MTNPVLDPGMSLAELEATIDQLAEHRRVNQADFWSLYPKQAEFVALGQSKDERLLLAPNQGGKTRTGGYEMAYHATGLYPPDWPGRRWRRPIAAWYAGISGEVVRDVQQTILFGNPHALADYGTGFIPKKHLIDKSSARGSVANLYDTVTVQHHTDGKPDGASLLQSKAYKQGQLTFQGRTLDFVWWDEEPDDMAIYTEGNARWSATSGMSFMTFTPWQGYTGIVTRFLEESSERRGFVRMGVDDCPHFTPDMVEAMKSKYPEHEWPARIYGEPALGTGAVFTLPVERVSFPHDLVIPDYWRKIWGIDFSPGEKFAAVLLATDPETHEDYVIAAYRPMSGDPMVHSDAMRRICSDAPVAWPHDGHVAQRNIGGDMMPIYKQFDLNMLPTHAQFVGGGYSTEAAVAEMQQDFRRAGGPGGLRVREDLIEFWNEYRQYHRKVLPNGRTELVKRNDHLLSALMKARMMRRFAKPVSLGQQRRQQQRVRPVTDFDIFTGEPIYERAF